MGTAANVAGNFGTIGAGIKGIAGLFGLGSGPSQEDLMKWQESMLQKQLDFQSSEAQKQRDWQLDMWNKNNQYNTLAAQMRRVSDAGVNPYALVNGSSYSSQASQMPSGAMPSGTGSIPQPAPNTDLQSFEGFNLISSAMKNIADAKRQGVDTDFLEKSFNTRLDSLIKDNNLKDAQKEILSLTAYYLPKEKNAQISAELAKVRNLDAQTDNFHAQLYEIKANIDRIISETNLNKSRKREIDDWLDKWFDKYYDEQIKLFKSEQTKNYASANLSSEQAVTQTAIRENLGADTNLKKQTEKYQKALTESTALDNEVRSANKGVEKSAKAAEYINYVKQAGIATEQQQIALEMARKNQDWDTFERIMGQVHQTCRDVAGFIPGASPASYTESTGSTISYDKNGNYAGEQRYHNTSRRGK